MRKKERVIRFNIMSTAQDHPRTKRERQTDRQADRQTERRMDGRTDRQYEW